MRLGTCLECIRSLLRVSRACQDGAREFTGRRPTLVRRLLGVAKGLPGVVVRKHKSHRDEGSSHAATQGKEPATPSEDDSSPAYRLKSMNDLHGTRVHKDDEGYYFGRGVLHPYLAKDLYILPSKILMAQAAKQIVLADKELNEAQAALADSQHQLKEQNANRRKVDDDLLKMMKENETLKTKLSSKCIVGYKHFVGAYAEWSLPNSFSQFIINFNLNKFEVTLPELLNMLREAESVIKKEKPILYISETKKKKEG
ncbi:hypothetical protein B296_00053894 [Ensete ventricosum]|uniref:Uncharacterized protein n=1 Tax=Ensete ventricosum TaxID=4639 RepID=A0A426XH99_ENSVE|nr:hypothetical protein B296_00053894 [Ensete ventricosum]